MYRLPSPTTAVRLAVATALVIAPLSLMPPASADILGGGAVGAAPQGGQPVVNGVVQPRTDGRDASSADKALASCWDVKMSYPNSPSGLYWLYTPSMAAPDQFYCDMTTDGGGWVLIGRGREGWSFLEDGQGSSAEVAATITGTAAFAPKHLNGTTVRGLLNGGAVQSLPDGLRVRRAATATGSLWQEVRLYPSRFGDWRWALGATYPLTKATYNGVAVAGGWTVSNGADTARGNTMRTSKRISNTFLPGFGYGSQIIGTNSATTYMWSATNAGWAIPFAQLYLRPHVRWDDLTWPSVAAGLPSTTVRSTASNLAAAQPAGVSGLANGFTTERDTEVRALAQIGSTMFVGGNFAQVDDYVAKTSTPQKYLAAFDVNTGAWIPGFRPVLNGKVNALVALPGGQLAVGGEFTTVNGAARAGLVALDPVTGQADPGFTSAVELRANGVVSPGTVTAMGLSGTTLYLGGSFSHLAGGGAGFSYLKRAARIDATTGRPDAAWNPAFDGTPIFVRLSAAGDRAYYGGFMATMNDGVTPAYRFTVVSTGASAVPVPGLAKFVPSTATGNPYQQTGIEVGDRFWLGGSEHAFFMYNRPTFALLRGNITQNDNGGGGDFQSSAADGDVVYGSCHCILSHNYGGATTWPVPTNFDDVEGLRYIGAYDATTGHMIGTFQPQMETRAVRGPWAMTVDSNGVLWAGGDTTRTKVAATTWQTSGGFSRFPRVDTVAPATPATPTVTDNGDGTVTVAWSAAETGLRFQLYRGDQVVWSGTSWKATLPAVAGAAYAVRATDKAGNTSATTAQVMAP